MIHLHTLGTVNLSGRDGRQVQPVLCQPKRLALLAYLAVATPRGFHRRDKLIALFWPECDADHARGALNQAVYMLRRALGGSVLVSRGGEEIGIRDEAVWCDAAEFERALEEGRPDEALGLYGGDLMDGFYISDAPDFEHWLERERVRLRGRAAQAAWELAEAHEKRGQAAESAERARWAAALAPGDERALRRLVSLLGRLGDRAGAVRAYEEFAERFRREYELEPSAESRALIERVRSGEEPARRAPRADPARFTSADSRAVGPALEDSQVDAVVPRDAQSDAPSDTQSDAQQDAALSANDVRPRRRWRMLAPVAVAVGLLAVTSFGVYGALADRPVSEGSRALVDRTESEGLGASRGWTGSGFSLPAGAASALAVLPFVNLSADAENEYFSDGLTEEILSGLGRVEGLQVAARTSSFAFKGRQLDLREIGRRLGAGYILEGSVRKADERLRVSARLVDVATGYEVWSQTYDRQVKDVFAIQEEISGAIVEALTPRVARARDALPGERDTHDLEAYNLYLRGRYHFNLRSVDAAQKAVEYFEEAIARDSSFARAYAGLADVYALLPYYRAARAEEILSRAEAAARRAIELDSTLPEPHSTLGWISFTYRWDWKTAEREFEEALRINPSHTDALHFYSLYLARVQGRHEQAIALATRAQRLDPLSPTIHTGAGAVFYHARQYERAIAAHRHALALDSAYSVARYMLAEPHLASGRPADAIRELNQIARGQAPSGDRTTALLGYAYAMLGRRSDALQMLERAKRGNVSPVVVAMLYTILGDTDAAFAWLERAADERDPLIVELRHEPLLDPLRTDPRFNRLAERIGLP